MNKETRLLNKENNILDSKIKEENQAIFTDMICYLRSSNLSAYNIEVVRNDLTEMILSAQERGENINDVVGDDYKDFCNSIIDTFPPKTISEKISEFTDTLSFSLAILLFINMLLSRDYINLIAGLISGKNVTYSIPVTPGILIQIIAIITFATFLVHVITKNSLSLSESKEKLIIIIACIILSIALALSFMLRTAMFNIHALVLIGLIILFSLIHIIISRVL